MLMLCINSESLRVFAALGHRLDGWSCSHCGTDLVDWMLYELRGRPGCKRKTNADEYFEKRRQDPLYRAYLVLDMLQQEAPV